MYYVVAALFVINCFVLMFVILLQQGKGGDIASAFGGGSSQTAFGARGGATVLSKATAILAALFMTCALALAIIGQGGRGSLLRGTPGPAAPPPTQTPAGTAPAAPAAPAPTPAPAQPAEPAPSPTTP